MRGQSAFVIEGPTFIRSVRSVQFSSVQFSSVQFSSVRFVHVSLRRKTWSIWFRMVFTYRAARWAAI